MVTPTNGTALFRGASGRAYAVDVYISDVVGASCRFNLGGAAGAASDAYYVPPEPVVLEDLSVATGPTVMVGLNLTENGGVRPGTSYRIANFLNTLTARPRITVAFPQGALVGAVQF